MLVGVGSGSVFVKSQAYVDFVAQRIPLSLPSWDYDTVFRWIESRCERESFIACLFT